MTLVSGVCLTFSLIILLGNIPVPLDPVWATVAISGIPLFYIALTRLLRERKISSALLISIAMVASIAIGELFAAGEVAFIMAIGAILEDKTVERAKKGIKNLISLIPEQGRRIAAGRESLVPVTAIRRGDTVRILPGETVPVDGNIISGNTSIDQSVMTGESLPMDKAEGDSVFSGTINRFGSIDIEATRVGNDSSLQKLVKMVQEAENNKAPMQRIVDMWASWLVPVALAISVIAYFATGDIIRAVTVLVVFCPCALALATPTSIMAAIGQASRYGVIIKSGEALENMGKVDRIAFDKTGTLTYGALEVSDVISAVPTWSADDLLRFAASAESRSEHPLGKAVVARSRALSLELKPVQSFRMTPGKGILTNVAGKIVLCGTAAFLEESGVTIDSGTAILLEDLRREGKATVLVGVDKTCIGMIAFADVLRESAGGMVRELKELKTGVSLLTGDHVRTALYFAGKAGIDDVYSELLPAQKVERIKEMQKQGHVVCMIGDGVNDAPALKIADVGVAMGSMGSDIAVDAADIALIGDDIDKIPYLKKLSNATISTIKFNIAMSMALNCIAIGLSVVGLLNPVTGALAHNVGSVFVVLNAAMLYDRKIG
jgi:heavy metal translocating P-type ATPase